MSSANNAESKQANITKNLIKNLTKNLINHMVYMFLFVVADLIVILVYPEAKNACGPYIWYFVLYTFVCGITGLLFMFHLYVSTMESSHKYIMGKVLENIYATAGVAKIVWVLIIQFNMDSECINTFSAAYPGLWIMTWVHRIYIYVSLSIVIVPILFAFLMICGACCDDCMSKRKQR